MAAEIFQLIDSNQIDDENQENIRPPLSTNSQRNQRKPPVRFFCHQDILLLREIVAVNPYAVENPKKIWEEIAQHLQVHYPMSGRRCRERCSLLLDHYIQNDISNLRKSGTEEEYQEKEQILQEIKELRDEGADIVKQKKSKEREKSLAEAAMEIRNAAMESVQARETALPDPRFLEVTSTRKRKSTSVVATYLQEKYEKEFQLKQQELHLKEAQLELDRETLRLEKDKFEVDREERINRAKQDSDERKVFLDIIKNFQNK